MFQVLYRLQGAGLWSPWFLPGSAQAASGHVRLLKKEGAVADVRVDGTAALNPARIDVKV